MNNSILTNITGLAICNDFNLANSSLSTALERMSSGLKLVRAKDDTAGCVISSKMSVRLNGTYQAQKNLQNGTSMLNVASGAYQNMEDILIRLRDLSLRAMDDSYDEEARKAFEEEANELTAQLKQIRDTAEYNGIKLFNNFKVDNPIATTNLASPSATGYSLRSNAPANEENEIEETPQEEPMMFAMRRSGASESGEIIFDAGSQSKTFIVDGKEYYIYNSAGAPNTLTWSYNNGKMTINGSNLEIYCRTSNTDYNITVNGDNNDIDGAYGNDVITVNGDYNRVVGLSGDDIINVTGNYNYGIYANEGNDKITVRGNQNQEIIGGLDDEENDEVTVIGDSNYFMGCFGTTNVVGDSNSIIGGYRINITGDSNSHIIAPNVFDSSYPSSDDVVVINGNGNNYIYTGDGNDSITITGDSNFDINPGNGNNIINITGDSNSGVLIGDGNDVITIKGDSNRDIQTGDGDDSILIYGNGTETVNAQEGNDVITIYGDYNFDIIGGNDEDETNIVTVVGDNNMGIGDLAGSDSVVTAIGDYNNLIVSFGTTNIKGDYNSMVVGQNVCINGDFNDEIYSLDTAEPALPATDDNFTIIGNNNTNIMTGGGNDTINISGDSNTGVSAGDGDDIINIFGGNGNEIFGDAGNDILYDQGKNTVSQDTLNYTQIPLEVGLQIGSEAGIENTIKMEFEFNLGAFNLEFDTSENASENIEKIDNLLSEIHSQMSEIGSSLNRLDSIYELQNKEIENLSLTKSLITDADIALEATNFTKNQILQQVSTSLFSQSYNIAGNLALRLLEG